MHNVSQRRARLIAGVALASCFMLRPTFASADALYADVAHSVAQFSIKHLVVTDVRGTINLKAAEMVVAPGSTIPSAVDATLDVGTIDTADGDRDTDLRSAQWFDAQRYPTMRFQSSRVIAARDHAFEVTGQLTIHGVTKPVSFAANFEGEVVDQSGRRHLGYSAKAEIDRRDFGIDALRTTPGGTLIVGNVVQVTIELDMVEGMRKSAPAASNALE
jgi:polyisoprenoid-binding protein YceI